jgi:hypothetical protein
MCSRTVTCLASKNHLKAAIVKLSVGFAWEKEYFRLLVREKVKIHRSHERVFNGMDC